MVLVLGLAWGLGSAVAASESPTPVLLGGSASPSTGASAAAGKVVYKVGWTRPPDNLNPFIGYAAPAFEIWYLTYDSLVGYDPKTLSPMKGENSTGLATDWSVSDDGLTWTFTIRQNAKWDDGVALTAKDIAFTYNYVIQNKLENYTSYTNLIEKATAIDDYTVEFQCSKPKPDMIRSWVPIMPEHVWSKVSPKDATNGKYTNNPPYVGSGPYKAVEWKKNSHVRLVRNPNWWGPKPKIDEIFFMQYTNNDTLLQDLKAGTIDAGVDLTATQMKQLQEPARHHRSRRHRRRLRRSRLQLLQRAQQGSPGAEGLRSSGRRSTGPSTATRSWTSSGEGPPPRGRRSSPRTTTTTPTGTGSRPADVKYTYDPAIANQKLDEAGYPDSNGDGVREYKGKPIELGLIARDESVQSQQTGKLMVGWFKDVGITVKLEVMDEATLGDRELNYEGDVFTPDFDMFLWGWYLDYDPGSMLSYLTKGQIENWNETCWWNPEYEKLYVQQGQELDAAKRKPLIDRMQQILYEQTPYIVTDYGPDFEAYNTAKWEGYIQIPYPNGNTLLPPFGNGGHANFLSIGPKTGEATQSSGSSLGLWVAVAVAAVAVAIVVLLVVLRRRPRAIEE